MKTRCNQLVGLNGYALSGMGEVTDQQVMQIFKEELTGISAATLTQVVLTGDYTPIKEQLKKASARVCKAGIIDEGTNFLKEYWYYILAGIVLYFIFS